MSKLKCLVRKSHQCDSMKVLVIGGIENTVEKGDWAGNQHFLLFTSMVLKDFDFSGLLEIEILQLRIKKTLHVNSMK